MIIDLILGDPISVMQLLPEQCVDAIISIDPIPEVAPSKANRYYVKLLKQSARLLRESGSILLDCVEEGETLLDPFMRDGTLAIYCIKNNINFAGIESNLETYNNAKERIINYLNEHDIQDYLIREYTFDSSLLSKENKGSSFTVTGSE